MASTRLFARALSPLRLFVRPAPAVLSAAAVLGGSLLLAGCPVGGKQKPAGGAEVDILASVDPNMLRNEAGLIPLPYDINNDGRADIIVYFQRMQSMDGTLRDAQVLKEVDLNFDGQIDLWRVWKYDGAIARQWEDVNGDSKPDVQWYFEDNRPVRREFDVNGDGRYDMTEILDAQGGIVERSRDTNGDGIADYFEFYTNGRLDKLGWDTTGDGKADEYEDPQPAYQTGYGFGQGQPMYQQAPAPAPMPAPQAYPPQPGYGQPQGYPQQQYPQQGGYPQQYPPQPQPYR